MHEEMMRKEVLDFIRKRGYINVLEIARKFKEPPDKIELLLQQFVELGYLDYASSNCVSKACNVCPLRSTCPVRNSNYRYYKVKKFANASRG
ncbi:MAG: FeoC-like transcriptional regulator [Caldisphaeraceae archaeon]|nr:FeoC-like transcriptional regulator [Caldisphaeraceae archaeon]MEB3692457.1 FeoC-like transcriptional regulator [Caldisphaeraceae archaeon]MEB3797465.1 FeoC-like transcriptional regulator [Caldisphaeraceae archaeon]